MPFVVVPWQRTNFHSQGGNILPRSLYPFPKPRLVAGINSIAISIDTDTQHKVYQTTMYEVFEGLSIMTLIKVDRR